MLKFEKYVVSLTAKREYGLTMRRNISLKGNSLPKLMRILYKHTFNRRRQPWGRVQIMYIDPKTFVIETIGYFEL